MKKILFISLLFCSCTKTKIVKVIEPAKTSIVGSWKTNQVDQLNPTFTENMVNFGYEQPYKYIASQDSIYIEYNSKVVYCQFSYKISNNNDTLYLTSVFPNNTTTYFRIF